MMKIGSLGKCSDGSYDREQGKTPRVRMADALLNALGVIAGFVPKRTLSGIEEDGARISQRSKPLLERLGWPDVVAIRLKPRLGRADFL